MERSEPGRTGESAVYSPAARHFHWTTVAFVVLMIPLGLYMVWRGNATDFDATTNQLYSLHKLLGFVLLWLVVVRLVYRFRSGAPADEPTLKWWEKAGSHLTHWSLYALLLIVPFLGWMGVSLYGARGVFGLFSLPAIAGEDQDAAGLVFTIHFYAAMLLLLLAGMHIAAALFHYFIRKDGVLQRMLPGLGRR